MDLQRLRACTTALLALTVGLLMGAVAYGAGDATISPGDLVFIKVHRHPELSTTTQVDETGNVQLKYAGNVSLLGLTDDEGGARVGKAYSTILKNPRVQLSRTAGIGGTDLSQRTEEMDTRVVSLSNAHAEVLTEALSGMSTAGGSVSFDPATNALIVTDTPSVLMKMMGVIEELDQMQSQITQVHIEAKIAEVESTAAKEIGVRWFIQGDRAGGGYSPNPRQDTRVNSVRTFNDPLFNERIGEGGHRSAGGGSREYIDQGNWDRRLQIPLNVAAPGQIFFGYMNSGIDFGSLLDALVADNKAQMLAAPYIRTVNHKPAHIEMTEKFPFSETGSVGLGTVSTTRFIDIGITLDVTPHVRDSNGVRYIQLELEPEVSTATGIANGVPVRSVRTSKSTANVCDGQTLVIGGIVQNDERNVVQKVPGLGNVPLVGLLFTHKERSQSGRELMIFVTPTVFDQPQDVQWGRRMAMPAILDGGDIYEPLDHSMEMRKE